MIGVAAAAAVVGVAEAEAVVSWADAVTTTTHHHLYQFLQLPFDHHHSVHLPLQLARAQPPDWPLSVRL